MPALRLEAAVEFIIREDNLISSNILGIITVVYHLTLGSQLMFLVNTK